jgi:hypothetical protein
MSSSSDCGTLVISRRTITVERPKGNEMGFIGNKISSLNECSTLGIEWE